MTVCRYFERGCCRYGDRCRFEHIQTNRDSYNYNQRNVENYQERYGRQRNEYSNYHQNDYQQRNQRYESRNFYPENQQNYSPERYQDNYHYQSQYENQYQNRYKQTYEQQPRYDEYNNRKNQQYSSNYYDNKYGQNRYRWLSDDLKNQSQHDVKSHENNFMQDSYSTSTPKGKVAFSFKVPESEVKKTMSTLIEVDEQDQLYANTVKEDAKSWEMGGQWPFTCYYPSTGKHGYPGFYDVSPEELRYAAYNAEKNNSYESYIQAVQNALVQVNKQRSDLQVPTAQLLSILRRIRNGEDLYSTSKMINPISLTSSADTVVESMETAAFSIPASSAAASFSFKIPTETDSAAKASSANFSFKLPAATDLKTVSTSISDGDTEIYTPFGNLTDNEKEQFSASTFTLGKIPTKPPSQVFCT